MRSIDEMIGNEDALRRLRSAVAAQEALLARIRAMLPGELAPHCVGATVDGHTLRLLADSAAWATRLRYLGRDLIRRLRADAIAVSAGGGPAASLGREGGTGPSPHGTTFGQRGGLPRTDGGRDR